MFNLASLSTIQNFFVIADNKHMFLRHTTLYKWSCINCHVVDISWMAGNIYDIDPESIYCYRGFLQITSFLKFSSNLNGNLKLLYLFQVWCGGNPRQYCQIKRKN